MHVAGPVLCRLEDQGVDQPNERRVGDPVVGLEIVLPFLFFLELGVFLVEHRAGTEGLGGAGKPAHLGLDVLAGGDRKLDLVAAGESKLVDCMDVLGIGDGDSQRIPLELVRDGDEAFEDVQREQVRRFPRNAGLDDVDERQVVLRRQRTRDAGSLDEPFRDKCFCEGTAPRSISHEGELVRGQEAGRFHDVGDQLGERVDLEGGLKRRRLLLGDALRVFHAAQLGWTLRAHASNEVSAAEEKGLRPFRRIQTVRPVISDGRTSKLARPEGGTASGALGT